MKLTTLFSAQLLTLSSASSPNFRQSPHDWIPAGPNDVRGPCPMMNTLANHAFLPHTGLNITKGNAVYALSTALNFNTSLAELMWDKAIIANPEPNATFFTLDHLNRHNILEHDASLSRPDFALNATTPHLFSPATFAQTTHYWTSSPLTAPMIANSKLARQIDSRAFNPNYTFTTTTEAFSLGEMAAPFIAFGDLDKVTVDRELVTYFFEKERLPVELGWTRSGVVVGVEDIMRVVGVIGGALGLFTGEVEGADFHGAGGS